MQVQEIASDLLVAELIRRTMAELGQAGDALHVGLVSFEGIPGATSV
jgi:hypothetical protein